MKPLNGSTNTGRWMAMTLDEMISVFKNGDLQDIDYELMINAEQLLYWLTE